ncbi:MAG: helix-turn-helix domain-containing protein [Pseudonocardiales bacterium]|nr:MAG: helix-turn-helix domain-containing protein [Pseudonocardiales bacterium]
MSALSHETTSPTPELLTIAETCDALRISKWSLYRLIQERKLATIKIGARRLVPRDDLRNLVSQLRAEGDDDGR